MLLDTTPQSFSDALLSLDDPSWANLPPERKYGTFRPVSVPIVPDTIDEKYERNGRFTAEILDAEVIDEAVQSARIAKTVPKIGQSGRLTASDTEDGLLSSHTFF